jgi:hypothetical protein
MVINLANINKTNNHLSLQLIEHKNTQHMMLEIQVMGLVSTNMWQVKTDQLDPKFSSLDNWIYKGNACIYK